MAGTWTVVSALPECDIHKCEKGEPGVEARFDGKTKRGPWANMCEPCFGTHGIGLGVGRGQRLILRGEPTPLDEAVTCKHCGRVIVHEQGAWVDPEATGDDSVWRETCDAHDTFTAEHEPG